MRYFRILSLTCLMVVPRLGTWDDLSQGLLVGRLWGEELRFQTHVLNADAEFCAAAVVDVNHDRRPDIVCGSHWYEAPDWERHFVREVEQIRGRFDGYAHLPLDVNQDGWMDIITANFRSQSLRWIEHPGASLGPWTIHTIAEPGPMETGRLVDVDQDGELDLFPNGQTFAAWWSREARESDPFGWTRYDLPQELAGHGLGFGDIDGDGRGDIVGRNGWAQAPEDRRHGRWQWYPEFQLGRASIPILVVDVDRDGDNDLVWGAAHAYGLHWLEQSKTQHQTRVWNYHTIDSSWSQCHAPLWGDLDGDGASELIAGKRFMAHEGRDPGEYDPLVSYRYEFVNSSRTWKRSPISRHSGVGFGLDPKLADLDQDGDLDLVVSGRSGLYWLDNGGPLSQANTSPDSDDRILESASPAESDVLDQLELQTPFDVAKLRERIVRQLVRSWGSYPEVETRVPLRPEFSLPTVDSRTSPDVAKQMVRFHSAPGREATALLWLPRSISQPERGILLIASTTQELNSWGDALSKQGLIVLGVELPSDRDDKPMTELWGWIRAMDLLISLPQVDPEKLGCVAIGDAAAEMGLSLAVIEPRIVTMVCHGQVPPDLKRIVAIAPRTLSIWTSTDQPALNHQLAHVAPIYRINPLAGTAAIDGPSVTADNVQPLVDWLKNRIK